MSARPQPRRLGPKEQQWINRLHFKVFGCWPRAVVDERLRPLALPDDLGITSNESFELWRKRYVRADGTCRATHYARLVVAVNVLRGPHPERLTLYQGDRRGRR